jgi:hypothetical protein
MARRAIQLLNDRRPRARNLLPTWAFTLERVTGIEPALSAWEADVLPLNYTRAQPAGGGHCSRQRPTTPVSVAQTSYRNRRGVGDRLRGQSVLAQSTPAVMSARTRDGISG